MAHSNKRKIDSLLKDAKTARPNKSTKRRKLLHSHEQQRPSVPPAIPTSSHQRNYDSDIDCSDERRKSLRFEEWRRKYQRSMNFYDMQKDRFVSDLHKCVQLHGHKGCVNTIGWEKSGKHLISGSDDQTCRIWDVFSSSSSPKTLCVLQGHLSNVFTAKFMYSSSVSGINNICVSGGNDADLHLYDINRSSASSAMFIAPRQSYRQHSRKVLNIAVTPHRPHELYSCSADGTVRHFDTRRKYTHQDDHSTTSHDIVIQAFGGGGGQNRGRFSESLLYDFNTCHRHCEVYSVDVHPYRAHELLCACADGNLYVMDMRKHSQGRCLHPIASFTQCHPNNAVAAFHNRRHRFPAGCHPTYATYNSDGAEILSTNISDACYVYINPTSVAQVAQPHPSSSGHVRAGAAAAADDDDDMASIMRFIEEPCHATSTESENANAEEGIDGDSVNDEDEEEEEDEEDEESFIEMVNMALMTRVASQNRERRFQEALNANDHTSIPNALWSNDLDFYDDDDNGDDDDDNNDDDEEDEGDEGHFDDDMLEFVETLMRRKSEVDRNNASDEHMQFQNALIDSLSKVEKILQAPSTNMERKRCCDKCKWRAAWKESVVATGQVKSMKWSDSDNCKQHKNDGAEQKKMAPPVDSNVDVFTCYDNQYYRFALQQYPHSLNCNSPHNINGMMIGEEPALHKLDEARNYFGRYIGHIHCDTLKQVAFFSDNYIVTGSDDSCIYIYDRLTGDIVNILDNETGIVNSIAVHPYYPMMMTSGLDSCISLWAPYTDHQTEEEHEEEDDGDESPKEYLFTRQVVENVVRLKSRIGVEN